MSWTASRWASRQVAGSPTAKLLLYVLADLSDENGKCWPTQRTLRDRSELGRRAVIDHLARLENAGLISRERRSDVMGRAADLYTLRMNGAGDGQLIHEVGARDAPTNAGDAPTGAPDAPGFVHDVHLVGAPRAHRNRPINRSVEPKRENRFSGELLSALRDEVWALTPSASRARSSRADLARALEAALKRGGDHEAIRSGVVAYFASPDARKDGGKFAKGVHRIVENDRWTSFTPAVAVEPAETTPAQLWRPRVKGFTASQFWNTTDWGPRPGKPGCTAPAAILAEFGLVAGVVSLRNGRSA